MLKKLVFGLSATALFFSGCCSDVCSFPGYFHYCINEKVAEKLDLKGEEAEAFVAAGVIADVGAFVFDKKTGIESDSKKFLKKMENCATTAVEKWFIKGWKLHVFLDEKTSEVLRKLFKKDMFGKYEYLKYYAVIDSYLKNKNGKYIYTEYLKNFDVADIGNRFEGVKAFLFYIFKTLGGNFWIEKMIFNEFYKNEDSKLNIKSCDDLLVRTYKSLGLNVLL